MAVEYAGPDGNRIIKPFGIPSRQPPISARIVSIPEVRVGFSAKQVCGYTDWSTLQLELPKKLLSKQYWNKIAKALEDQAKQTVLDLSYALPGMIACNVSPDFCHVYNQAEMMASFEGELSFNTCKILDGVANVSGLQAEELRVCVEGLIKSKDFTPSEARERCLRGDGKSPSNPGNQATNIEVARAETGVESKFNLNAFLDGIFPPSIRTSAGNTISFTTGEYTYTRRQRGVDFFKALFPGVEVRGTATIRNGGTFQPAVENELLKQERATKDAVLEILKVMQGYHKKGFAARDVLSKSQSTWNDRNKWIANKQPSPIYRETMDGSEPTFLIQPEQIYSLLPLADEGIDNNKALEQVIDRLSQATAFLKVQDSLFDIQTRTAEECERPDRQDAVTQANCQIVAQKTRLSMEFLERKALAEDRAVRVQNEISTLIDGVRNSQVGRIKGSPLGGVAAPDGKIPLPNRG
jgi:hypothetical protein